MDLLNEERFERRSNAWADLLPALRKRKRTILIVFLGTVLSAYATVEFVLWEQYESRANLLVKLGRENAEVPSTVQNSALFTSGIREQELKSKVQMLKSRDIVERVVDQVGVDVFKFEPPAPQTLFQTVKYYVKMAARWLKSQYTSFLILANIKKTLSDRDKAILAVERSLDIAPEKDSDVIAVRVRLPTPDLSMQVNRTLLDLFFEDYVRLHKSNESRQFFDAQANVHRQLLEAADQQREQIRSKFGLSSAVEQRTLLLQRLNDALRQMDRNASEKEMLREEQSVMRARLVTIPASLERSRVVTPNPAIQSIKDRLTVLQLDRARMLTRYDADSPTVLNIDEEIAALEAARVRESESQVGSVTSELNPLGEGFRRNVEEIDAKIAGLDASTKKQRGIALAIEGELDSLTDGEDQLEVLERERKMAEANYLTYSKRREEARIREQLDEQMVANVVLISPPSRPIEPVAPRKLFILVLALGFGLLLGVGFALLLDYLSDSVDTPGDIADLDGTPFLGSFDLQHAAGSLKRKKVSVA